MIGESRSIRAQAKAKRSSISQFGSMGPSPRASSRDEPAISYRFILEIDGHEFGSFSKVDGIQAKYEHKRVKEGGENGFEHHLLGRVSYTNITLSRALDPASARLATWFTEYQHLIRSGGRHRPTNGSITALSAAQTRITQWNFADIVPVTYNGPSFNASSSELAMEKFEFAHHGFWSGSSPSPAGA